MPIVSSSEKPHDLAAYRSWLAEVHKFNEGIHRSHYEVAARDALTCLAKSAFWTSICKELPNFAAEYEIEAGGYRLLADNTCPELLVKAFDSAIEKSYRHNVVTNAGWPTAPAGGWVLPENWFLRLGDVLWCRFKAKYLDGVEFLAGRIQKKAIACGHSCRVEHKARDEGYYAVHLDLTVACDLRTLTWGTERKDVGLEIQVTTEVQELILQLTHRYYERSRVAEPDPTFKWQWNYKAEEFTANYLGHILHYVEGMIMDIRDKQKGINK